MEFLNKIKANLPQILKIGGIAIAGLIVLSLLVSISGSSFDSLRGQMGGQQSLSFPKGGAMYESSGATESYAADKSIGLSARNVVSAPAFDGDINVGKSSENFEVTEYSASIETRDLKKTCAAISALKPLDYVIFESAYEFDTSCNYNFKVETKNKQEILDIIKKLDPKDLSENTQTIKNRIDDYTGEEEILKKKMASVENTLANAIDSYDEISRVATAAKDAESLAKIIDSKIRIIESLSQQKINISEQMDRISRSKAEQLDRLDYVYFNISIYENKFIDGENLKDSWKAAIKKFVYDTNQVLEDISINMILLILLIFQYALYILIILFALKYGWRTGKRIWQR